MTRASGDEIDGTDDDGEPKVVRVRCAPSMASWNPFFLFRFALFLERFSSRTASLVTVCPGITTAGSTEVMAWAMGGNALMGGGPAARVAANARRRIRRRVFRSLVELVPCPGATGITALRGERFLLVTGLRVPVGREIAHSLLRLDTASGGPPSDELDDPDDAEDNDEADEEEEAEDEDALEESESESDELDSETTLTGNRLAATTLDFLLTTTCLIFLV